MSVEFLNFQSFMQQLWMISFMPFRACEATAFVRPSYDVRM